MNDNTIKCPNCGEAIDVNEVYAHKTEEKYKSLLASEKEKMQNAILSKQQALEEERRIFQEKKKNENKIFLERIEKEKLKLMGETRKQLDEEYHARIKAQEEALTEKDKKLSELRDSQLEVERLKRKMTDARKDMEIEFEKRISKERLEYEEVVMKRERERLGMEMNDKEMKMKEQTKLIDDLKAQLGEAKRSLEQRSMQLQGEVQELAIEEYLRTKFVYDEISEIKKGQRGADCLQIINEPLLPHCGKILYESKRTKDYSKDWIPKLKVDMQSKGADIGVLVTRVLPAGVNMIGQIDGIWVCSFEAFKGLSMVLRNTIVRLHQERSSQENKDGKMSMLYNFLTSNEFRMQIEGIIEGFVSMKNDLDRERRAMEKLWKQREKQLEKVISNTTNMYGSIKGIAGAAIPTIEYLELPDPDLD